MDIYSRPSMVYSARTLGSSPRPNTPTQVWPTVSRERDFEAAASIIKASTIQPKPTTKTFVRKRTNSSKSKDVTFGKNIKNFLKGKSRGYVQEEDCQLCQKKIRMKQFPRLIQKSLFKNYSNSIDYYYTKDINDILNNNRCPATLEYNELKFWREGQDNFTSWVSAQEHKATFLNLWKYHQFNIDQPVQIHKQIHLVVDNHFFMLRSMQEKAIKRMLEVMTEAELEQCEIHLSRFYNQKVELLEQQYKGSNRLIFTQLSSTHSLGGDRSINTPSLSRIEVHPVAQDTDRSLLALPIVSGLRLDSIASLGGVLRKINREKKNRLPYPYLDKSEDSVIQLSSHEGSELESPWFLKDSSRESLLNESALNLPSPHKKEGFIRMEECAVQGSHNNLPLAYQVLGHPVEPRPEAIHLLSFKRKPQATDLPKSRGAAGSSVKKVGTGLAQSKSRPVLSKAPVRHRTDNTAAFLKSHEELLKIPKILSSRKDGSNLGKASETRGASLQRSKESPNLRKQGLVASATTFDLRRNVSNLKKEPSRKQLVPRVSPDKQSSSKLPNKPGNNRQSSKNSSRSPIKAMLDSLREESQKQSKRNAVGPVLKLTASQNNLAVRPFEDPLKKIKEIIESQKTLNPKHSESQPILAHSQPKINSGGSSRDSSAKKSRSRGKITPRLKSPLGHEFTDIFAPGARITAIAKQAFQGRPQPNSTRGFTNKAVLETIKFTMPPGATNRSSRSSSKELKTGDVSNVPNDPTSAKKGLTSSLNIYSSDFIHGIIGSRRQQAASPAPLGHQSGRIAQASARLSRPSPSPSNRGVSSGSHPSEKSHGSSPAPTLSFRPQTLRAPNNFRQNPGSTR